MAVGIYVRVSTEAQVEKSSLESQVSLCKQKAFELGFYESNIRIYREEGRSGEEDIEVRPEILRLRKDVDEGIITKVICIHPDRLSRDSTDQHILVREFERRNVELIFTDTEFKNTPEGRLFFAITSAIAAYELALIKKRTIRGREKAVEKDGKIMPMRVAPFGYDKDENGQLKVNEVERTFVQMIYEWYVFERLTLREIGERLYGKIKPKRGESANWNASSISRVLTSEIYIGNYYYNKRKTEKLKEGQANKVKQRKTDKTYSIRNKEDWLTAKVPPIVDVELWKLAQRQRVDNSTNKHVGNNKYEYLLKSLLKCGHCGRRFDATTYSGSKDKESGESIKIRHYRCPNTVPRKYGPEIKKCVAMSLNAEQIEGYIWGQVLQVITDPRKFISVINAQSDDSLDSVRDQIELFEKEQQKKLKALRKIERDYYEAETIEDEQYFDRLRKEFKSEIASIEREIEKCNSKISAHRSKELTSEQIQFMVQKLKDQLSIEGAVPFDVKRNIVETLFEEIIVTVTRDGGPDPDGNDEVQVNVTSVGVFDLLNRSDFNSGVCSHRQKIRQYRRRSGGPDLHRHHRLD